MTDPRELLPTILHAPIRLAILASLRTVQSADFRTLAEALDVTDPELSRQLAILEKAGLVDVRKSRRGARPVTQVRISEAGQRRFAEYLDHLRRLAFEGVPEPSKGDVTAAT